MPSPYYDVTPADREALRELVESARGSTSGTSVEAGLRELTLLAQDAPIALRRAIVDFRTREPAGRLVARGLPIDDETLGRTPDHWRGAPTDWTREDLLVLVLGCLLGQPFAWSTQQDGRLVHNVLPIKEHADEQLGSGTRQVLWWHTEDAFHEARPDYLLLLCLRNPDRVATTYADLSSVEVDGATFGLLNEARFNIRPDYSHRPEQNSPAGERPGEEVSQAFSSIAERDAAPRPIRVLFGDRRDPYLRLDPYFMSPPASPAHAEAFRWLCRQIDDRLRRVVLEPGDCLILDNYRAVHGRDAYEARYDGTDRWLKRVNVARDLRPSRGLRRTAASPTIYG